MVFKFVFNLTWQKIYKSSHMLVKHFSEDNTFKHFLASLEFSHLSPSYRAFNSTDIGGKIKLEVLNCCFCTRPRIILTLWYIVSFFLRHECYQASFSWLYGTNLVKKLIYSLDFALTFSSLLLCLNVTMHSISISIFYFFSLDLLGIKKRLAVPWGKVCNIGRLAWEK